MTSTVPLGQASEGVVTIRNEPVQARSTKRLATLLDSAAAVIDELGYERLTTAMVAERAGASIGTVYRYFPDRLAVLQALAARNYERVTERVMVVLADPTHDSWIEAMSAAFAVFVDAFRTEPGFRSLRIGDVIDLRPPASVRPANSVLADRMFDALAARFDTDSSAEARLAFEIAIEATDAIVARAFARDNYGDPAYLEQGRQLVRACLQNHFTAVG